MKKVEIYSTETCHFCQLAKAFFKENDIPYTEYNVGADTERREEMMNLTGQMGVPVIIIDGKDAVIGFNKEKLSSLLGI